MTIDETQIVVENQVPKILYRCNSRYFLQDHTNIDMPLREIDRETAWDLVGVSESLREILRADNPNYKF